MELPDMTARQLVERYLNHEAVVHFFDPEGGHEQARFQLNFLKEALGVVHQYPGRIVALLEVYGADVPDGQVRFTEAQVEDARRERL